jgi:hypothetical protein
MHDNDSWRRLRVPVGRDGEELLVLFAARTRNGLEIMPSVGAGSTPSECTQASWPIKTEVRTLAGLNGNFRIDLSLSVFDPRCRGLYPATDAATRFAKAMFQVSRSSDLTCWSSGLYRAAIIHS